MMWLCKLIGHKFLKSRGGWNYRSDHCWRCGYSPASREEGQSNA